MDVTPGPQLRRQITIADELRREYINDRTEWETNPDLPAPDWRQYAERLHAVLWGILPLVRS